MPKEKRSKKKIRELIERLHCVTESMEDHMYGCNLRQQTTLRTTAPPIVAVVIYEETFRVRVGRVKVKARLGDSPLKPWLERNTILISAYILRRGYTYLPLRLVLLRLRKPHTNPAQRIETMRDRNTTAHTEEVILTPPLTTQH